MTEDEIIKQLRPLVATRCEFSSELTLETDLLRDLHLDSMTQLELWIDIENHFEIMMEPDAENDIITIRNLVSLIHTNLHSTDSENAGP